ncbi:geraniol 8-hydroxylase [Trifolium repens]|nr:geraniol 8-hydroxylase [Trifolium repens]
MVLMDFEWLLPILSVPFTSVMFTLVALLGGFLVIYLYWPYWSVRNFPGPPSRPLVGNLPLLAKYGADIISVLAKQYGPVFRFHIGRKPIIIIADAELIKEVGIKKYKDIPHKSPPPSLAASPLHQMSLLMARDTPWATMRNAILPFFQPTHVSELVPTMQSVIETTTQNVGYQNEDFNIYQLILRQTIDMIGKTSLNVDIGLSKPKSFFNKEASDFLNYHIYCTSQLRLDLTAPFSIIMNMILPILTHPCREILKRIPGTLDYTLEHAEETLCGYLDDIIEKRMKDQSSKTSSKDLLSLVQDARESKSGSENVFTPERIRALAFEQLIAGATPVAFTLTSALYLVAGHPHVEKKLLQEIDEFGPADQTPTAQDLDDKFPYLDQVIKEAMRFFVIAPLIPRETSTKVEIGGYIFPKGAWVWFSPIAVAQDPKNFPEPEKFKPERFDPNCDEMKKRHPYAFVPFGIGPRACPGQKYALQQIKLTMINLYSKYLFRHSPDMEFPLKLAYGFAQGFVNGVKVRAIKRTD